MFGSGPLEVEQPYPVPTHLRAQQSIGPLPARFILPLAYAGVFCGVPLAVSTWHATNGLLPPSLAAGLTPPLLVSPIAAWWLEPPFEHGFAAAAAFVKRAYVPPTWPGPSAIAVYRMPSVNLETASAPLRRQARAQWGSILNGLTHPIKIIVRARSLTTLPVVEQLRADPRPIACNLGEWFETQLALAGLIERDRLLVIPAEDEQELEFRAEALEKIFRQSRLAAERIPPRQVPLVRTLAWNPKATIARPEPESLEEGTAEVEADGWWTSGHVERPRVPIDEWMNGLQPGDGWLRVAPIDGRWRQEQVRVALPRVQRLAELRSTVSVNGSVSKPGVDRPALTDPGVTESSAPPKPGVDGARPSGVLPPVPPDCPMELLAKMGNDVLAKLERRWSRKHHELGPCLVCRDDVPRGPDAARGPYGRMYDPALGKTDYIHLIVWRRCYPDRQIPKGWTIDHLCEVGLCGRPDHLDPRPVTHAENTRRRHQRAPSHADIRPKIGNSVGQFAITLFGGIDRTTVQPRTVSLDELAELLARFEVFEDKRRGRCWAPTKYADGATSRGNAGVESVSCLVFDCDRVAPDEEKLSRVHWIGHTTHSHTPGAPRWRVVLPLARPVSAKRWAEVWCRARAALCPEADPACKDPSRAYWLPSHPAGAAHDVQRHDGPLLDVRTLPELPPDERTIARRRPRKLTQRASQDRLDRDQAYMRQVVDNVASTLAGGRNAALNGAAWTLGRWIAAGALDQSDIEDALYAAAEQNGLVADDGERQCWATIRSGLAAGLRQPINLDSDR